MMSKWNWCYRLSALAVVLVATLSLSPVQAQTPTPSALGLTVSPVIDEFAVSPGQSSLRTIKIINPVHDILTLYPIAYNFTTDNQEGKPTFYTDQERSSTYSLASWVTFSKPFIRIAPGEKEDFQITVNAPSNAEAGGHYGAILFSTEKPEVNVNTNQVSVVGLIGTLLLATVPGDIHQNLTIEDFSGPTFLVSQPANFSLLFSNTGNIHLKPSGDIKIKNWFGNLDTTLAVNQNNGNILPQSKRHFDAQWTYNWKAVGQYTASATITYGTPEQQLTVMRHFYIIPVWFIVTLAILILILIGWVIRRKRRGRGAVQSVPVPTPQRPRYVMR